MPATWKMIGRPLSTADMAAAIPTVSQRFKVPTTKTHSLLQGAGLGVIFHAATFTALNLELWADRSGSPSKLIATSLNSWTKAQVDAQFPLDYKCVFMGFEFTPVPLRKGVDYHLALRASGYTGNTANHIAWRHQYPDPAYPVQFTEEVCNAAWYPLEAMIFATEF